MSNGPAGSRVETDSGRPEEAGRAAGAMVMTAVGLAAVSMVCLAVMLAINLTGGSAWAALSWIPMICLPLAFVLIVILLAAAVRRRRRS